MAMRSLGRSARGLAPLAGRLFGFVTEPEWPALSARYRQDAMIATAEAVRPPGPVQVANPIAHDDAAFRVYERAACRIHSDPDQLPEFDSIHGVVRRSAWLAHQRATALVFVHRFLGDEHDPDPGSDVDPDRHLAGR